MQLHGIIVEGREVLHDQFSLKEVWQAVEICQKGYLIAWKNQICLVSFGSGEGRAQSAVVLAEAEGDITEIAASDRLLAYRSDADQEIRLLSLES